MALLISAGLFVRSLVNVSRVDLGINTDNLVDVRDFTAAERLHAGTRAWALRAGRGRAGGDSWRDRRHARRWCRSSRQQLGHQRDRAGLPGRSGHRHSLELQRDRARLLPHAWHVACRGTRVHSSGSLGGGPRSCSSTKPSRGSSSWAATPSASTCRDGGARKLDMEIVGLVANAKYSEVKQDDAAGVLPPLPAGPALGFLNFYVRTSLAPEQMPRCTGRHCAARSEPAGREAEDRCRSRCARTSSSTA